jgi:hypothetical protein
VSAVDALEACLAQAQRGVWVLGLLGARLDDPRPADSFASHRRDRDDLLAALAARGATPPAPPASYDVEVPSDLDAGRRLAQQVEQDTAAAAAAAVRVTSGVERRLAVRLLQRSASRAVAWDAAPVAFPGLERPAVD